MEPRTGWAMRRTPAWQSTTPSDTYAHTTCWGQCWKRRVTSLARVPPMATSSVVGRPHRTRRHWNTPVHDPKRSLARRRRKQTSLPTPLATNPEPQPPTPTPNLQPSHGKRDGDVVDDTTVLVSLDRLVGGGWRRRLGLEAGGGGLRFVVSVLARIL